MVSLFCFSFSADIKSCYTSCGDYQQNRQPDIRAVTCFGAFDTFVSSWTVVYPVCSVFQNFRFLFVKLKWLPRPVYCHLHKQMSLHAWSDPVCIRPVSCFHQIILHLGIIFAVLKCGNLIQLTFLHDRQHLSLRFQNFSLLSRSSNSTLSAVLWRFICLIENYFFLCSIIFHSHFLDFLGIFHLKCHIGCQKISFSVPALHVRYLPIGSFSI